MQELGAEGPLLVAQLDFACEVLHEGVRIVVTEGWSGTTPSENAGRPSTTGARLPH
jgi:hypothetical protein